MRFLPALLLLAASAAPSPARAVTAAPSPAMALLERQADAGAALNGGPEEASRGTGEAYDGGGGFGSVKVLTPVEYVDADGNRTAGDGDANPSYHFVGKRTAIPNLTIYTPVKDKPGEDGRTEEPEDNGGLLGKVKKGLLWGGAAAAIGGVAAVALGASAWLFAPLLLLGGFALGAWAAIKFLSK